jgi:hypothetical protein
VTITQLAGFDLAKVVGGTNRPTPPPSQVPPPDDLAHQTGIEDITKNIRPPKTRR